MNYAPFTVFGVLAVVGIWWQVSAKHKFTGPIRNVDMADEGLTVKEPDPPPGSP